MNNNFLLDHLAIRVKCKEDAAQFYIQCLNYKQTEVFDIPFEDGTFAQCIVLSHESLPEIFISDGGAGSIVDNWQKENKSKVHHIALKVEKIEPIWEKWKSLGIKFTTEEILECPGVRQIFSEPQSGIIFELIERTDKGFCEFNVGRLMQSTEKLNK